MPTLVPTLPDISTTSEGFEANVHTVENAFLRSDRSPAVDRAIGMQQKARSWTAAAGFAIEIVEVGVGRAGGVHLEEDTIAQNSPRNGGAVQEIVAALHERRGGMGAVGSGKVVQDLVRATRCGHRVNGPIA